MKQKDRIWSTCVECHHRFWRDDGTAELCWVCRRDPNAEVLPGLDDYGFIRDEFGHYVRADRLAKRYLRESRPRPYIRR